MSSVIDISAPRATSFTPLSRRYVLAWLIVLALVSVDMVWMHASGHTVSRESAVVACKTSAGLMLLAWLLKLVARIPRYRVVTERLRYTRVADTAAWAAVLIGLVSVTCVLSYLCVSISAPLIDNRLAAFDHAIGFDWLAVYGWVQAHPLIKGTLRLAYESGQLQLIAVPLFVGLFGRREALSEFFYCLALASVMVLLISTPFPATSAFVHFNVSDHAARATVSDFELLRNGSLKMIDIAATQGLVSMPSFHTTLAVIFAYSLRQYRVLFGAAVTLNVVMILSTPTQGGHYLADVLAGLLLAVVTIVPYRVLAGARASAQ